MGKRTTTRHKEDNTFKFETFEDKLKKISVNVNLSIRDGRSEVLEDQTTYFFQEIEKWIDLNRTESFGHLLQEIGEDVKTLPQLLFQKDRLANLLLDQLNNRDNEPSYEPTFALIVALSRDLGPEFYPHYPKLCKTIIEIVITLKKAEVIENGFKCYAYLSKYLRKQIVQNLPQHLKLFEPLLNPKLKNYVVIFACEAFEVVVSKYGRDYPNRFLELVFKILLKDKPQHSIGLATLLFSIFKGVNGILKINGPGLKLETCIDYIFKLDGPDQEYWINVIKILLQRLLNHGNEKEGKQVFDLFENMLGDLKQRDRAPVIIPIYKTIVEYENCSKIPDIGKCVNLVKILTDCVLDDENAFKNLYQLIISLINIKGKSTNPEILGSFKSSIVKILGHGDLTCVNRIDDALQDTTHYFHSYLIALVKAYERLEGGKGPADPLELTNTAIKCVSEAVIRQSGFYYPLKKDRHLFNGMGMGMWFYDNQKKLIRPLNLAGILTKENFDCCQMMHLVLESLSKSINMENITRLFLSFSRISLGGCQSCLQMLPSIANAVIQQYAMCEDSKKSAFSMLLFFIFETMIMHGLQDASLESFLKDVKLQDLLPSLGNVATGAENGTNPFCLWSLKCLDLLVHYAKLSSEGCPMKKEVVEFVRIIQCQLESNLMCGFKMVRTLVLSILRNFIKIEDGDSKKTEMLEKFIEIEDMSVLDPKFSPLVKSALTEAKVLMESDTATQDIRELCLKYTLGLIYSNYNLIWPICIEVINLAGKNLKFEDFWKIFGNQFLSHYPNSETGEPRHSILEVEEGSDDGNEFMQRMRIVAFGFPKDLSSSIGLEESIDVPQYRFNLWKSLLGLPFGKQEYQTIKPIIDKTLTSSFEEVSTERGFGREIHRTLLPVFQFLEKCDHANADLQLWERGLDHLISTPDIQKAVWEFLHAKRRNKLKGFKMDIDEIIGSDSMDSFHKFRIDAIDTTQNKQYENETVEKRKLLMDIVIRVLIGKERKWKAEKRLQSLRFIGGCKAEEAKKYLELTVGAGLNDLRISPKALEVKINKIGNCIRAWRYKFPSIMDELLNLVCDVTSSIGNLKKPFPKHSDEEELPEQVFEEQKKGALKAARQCIIAFFQFLPKFSLDSSTIDRIFDTFIWNGIEELTAHTGLNISWIMKLLEIWSKHARFHVLLAKCKDGDFEENISPMKAVFKLLELKTTHFDVQKFLVEILLNLAFPEETEDSRAEDGETETAALDQSELFDGRKLKCTGIYPFPGNESIGPNIVLNGKRVLLNLFQDPQLFKKMIGEPGGDKCLALISKLVEYVDKDDQDLVEKMCSIVIETFGMYKNSEENLYNCLIACKNLMSQILDSKPLLMKLAPSFIWIQGRRLRTGLSDILNQDTLSIIKNMNAWSDMAVDTPDFSLRQTAFQELEELCIKQDFNLVVWTLAAANCFHNLQFESDIGMKNSAKNLFVIMSESLKDKCTSEEVKTEVKQFLDLMIIPRLRIGLFQKDESRFADVLLVLIAFVQNGKDLHGTFKQLNTILNKEIIDGLIDIQLHLRTRAMNKLCIKVSEVGRMMSPTILKNFIMALANHNLLDEEKLGQNRDDLIHSSIETLKAILQLLPHDHYFKYMTQLVSSPKKKTRLAKQYERILVAVMDAFHFDMGNANGNASGEERLEAKPVPAKAKQMDREELDDDEEEDENDNNDLSQQPDPQNVTILSKPAATKCLRLLKTIIIPKLREYLNFEEKATHKLSRSNKSVDDDVILKIPCTLALVKLLKKLPKLEGKASIRSIMPCLCAGLRNELYSTRHSLRKTILSVIKELGVSQFRTVIGYMKATLQRGYQRHVLTFTIGYFMKCLEPELRTNTEFVPIKEVLPLCEEELYGVMQEEKELAAIKAKTKEASKNNAHPILKLCAKCVQRKDQLDNLIEPAIKQLMAKRSPKVAKTTRQWLSSISEGLADNLVLNHLELINWLKQVMKKESVEEEEEIEIQPEKNKKRKLLVEGKDAFIVPVLRKKGLLSDGKITGHFLLTEFAFTSLYNGLNKSTRLKEALLKMDSIFVLDDFVKPLGNGIQSSSKQVNIISLRCLTLLFEFDLPSFKDPDLIDKLRMSGFTAMNNHCYRTTTDTQMSNATFKFLTAFFSRFPNYKIVVQDFELMLKCIQAYLTSDEGSSAALTLLKGVLKNRFKSSNLQDLMEDVFKHAIQSLYQHINEACRQAYIIYLNNYCTNPKELTAQVRLILNQFEYPIENGRLTSVEIMSSLVSSIPESCLDQVKELIFLKTIMCLDHETEKPVRTKMAEVLKNLVKNDGSKSLVRLFLKLLNSGNHNTELDTFFLVGSVLVEDAKIFTGQDLGQLLNKIEQVLNPEKFEQLCTTTAKMTQQVQDYAVFQALNCFKKLLERKVNKCSVWETKFPYSETTQEIFKHVWNTCLLYEHVWIPPVAIDVLFQVVSKLDLSKEQGGDNNVVIRNSEDLGKMGKNVWKFLKFGGNEHTEDSIMKGTLVFVQLGSLISRLDNVTLFESIVEDIRKSVNHEVVKDPKNTKIRSLAFACLRGVVSNSRPEGIRNVAETLTRLVVRELTDDGISNDIKIEAEKLSSVIRSVLGHSEFNTLYAQVTDFYHKKRHLNRAKKKESFVLYPGKIRKRPQKTNNDSKIYSKKPKKS